MRRLFFCQDGILGLLDVLFIPCSVFALAPYKRVLNIHGNYDYYPLELNWRNGIPFLCKFLFDGSNYSSIWRISRHDIIRNGHIRLRSNHGRISKGHDLCEIHAIFDEFLHFMQHTGDSFCSDHAPKELFGNILLLQEDGSDVSGYTLIFFL